MSAGRIAVWIAVCSAISACAPRGPLTEFPQAGAVGAVETVFVATSRQAVASSDPEEARADDLTYESISVSVPPDRDPGTIRFPESAPDPRTDFLVTDRMAFANRQEFGADLRQAFLGLPQDRRQVVLYVHGFNNTFAEGVLRLSQLHHDLNLPGLAVHYSWPSAGNPLNYAYDHDSAMFARDGLEEVLRTLESLPGANVTVIAHSMGAYLTMEAFRQMAIARPGTLHRSVNSVVLVSPDIDVDVFRTQARRIGRLPDPFVIFASKRDRALLLSARLTGQSERLGNIQAAEELADLEITLIDVTAFSEGFGHFAPGTSPALIQILGQVSDVDAAFRSDRSGRSGLLPGTVLTVQNMTQVILSPVSALGQ